MSPIVISFHFCSAWPFGAPPISALCSINKLRNYENSRFRSTLTRSRTKMMINTKQLETTCRGKFFAFNPITDDRWYLQFYLFRGENLCASQLSAWHERGLILNNERAVDRQIFKHVIWLNVKLSFHLKFSSFHTSNWKYSFTHFFHYDCSRLVHSLDSDIFGLAIWFPLFKAGIGHEVEAKSNKRFTDTIINTFLSFFYFIID